MFEFCHLVSYICMTPGDCCLYYRVNGKCDNAKEGVARVQEEVKPRNFYDGRNEVKHITLPSEMWPVIKHMVKTCPCHTAAFKQAKQAFLEAL